MRYGPLLKRPQMMNERRFSRGEIRLDSGMKNAYRFYYFTSSGKRFILRALYIWPKDFKPTAKS